MQLVTSFSILCFQSFASWLLTNAIGLLLLYLGYVVFIPSVTGNAVPTDLNLTIFFYIEGWLAGRYLLRSALVGAVFLPQF